MNIGSELLLVGAVAAVGILHTIVPDHWMPRALIARQRGWSKRGTAAAAPRAGDRGVERRSERASASPSRCCRSYDSLSARLKMIRSVSITYRHPRESGGPEQAIELRPWIPAGAAMTR